MYLKHAPHAAIATGARQENVPALGKRLASILMFAVSCGDASDSGLEPLRLRLWCLRLVSGLFANPGCSDSVC